MALSNRLRTRRIWLARHSHIDGRPQQQHHPMSERLFRAEQLKQGGQSEVELVDGVVWHPRRAVVQEKRAQDAAKRQLLDLVHLVLVPIKRK